MDFKLVLDAKTVLAETPIWDARLQRLYWTDLMSGQARRFDPATGRDEAFETGRLISSAVPCTSPDKLLVTLDNGIFLLDLTDGRLTLVAEPNEGDPAKRYNDTRVDARGRIFTSTVSRLYGSPEYRPDMLGDFLMIDLDGSVKKIVSGINQYNAIVWNHDSSRMYVVDTHNMKLIAFDYDLDKGPVSGPREAIDLREFGMPDGMSVDAEDHLYICHWTGYISVWNADLTPKGLLRLPVEFVCCTGFGGADGKDLYAATSRFNYTEEQLRKNPGAGGLFMARCDVAGLPEHFYPDK